MRLLPLLPLTLGGHRLGLRLNPPSIGKHSASVLRDLGYSEADIESLQQDKVVGMGHK